jgi:predicted alpha/beta superfamily hydrolase
MDMFRKHVMALTAAVLGWGLTGWAQAPVYTPDDKVVVPFAMTWDTGPGRELFVVGNNPDLGDWNPVAARKLHWTDGNVWTGSVAVNAGNSLEYKYIVRTNTGAEYCAAGNVAWMADPNLVTSTPVRAGAPFTGKIIYYYSGWTNAALLYQSGSDTNWQNADMQRMGAGRVAGEYLYRTEGVGQAGELLTFVPHGYADGDPTEKWDNCPIAWVQDYFTRLDAFVLQDGHIYNYWPTASGSASAIATHYINSSYTPQAPSRNIRVYVPRNYSQNTIKRYPVLYLHDGQNVFQPGGAFGCWDAEVTADDMISLGLMRETILVAIDNTAERTREYIPPTDSADGTGTADKYLAFVANNVMPFVDANYRTLTGPEDTGVLGSSFGGVASLYFGMASNRFGRIGPMSTSFWAIPNYLAQRIYGQDTAGLRIYTDFGTAESEPNYQAMWSMFDKFLADGYVPNDTVRIEVGCGHAHNEPAWAQRVYMPMTFLFNTRDEANWIAQNEHPPRLAPSGMPGAWSMAWTGMKGIDHVLQRSGGDLAASNWTDVATGRVENLMWADQQVSEPSGAGMAADYRLQCRPAGD